MYKILTHMHTQSPSVHRYHRVKNDKGEWVDFQTDNLEDAETEVLEILKRVGDQDVTVVEEHPFYIDLYYGEDEEFTGEEEKEEALNMLHYLGWEDLKISDNKPFSIDLIWGVKPEMEPPKYNIVLEANVEAFYDPETLTNIVEGSSCSSIITFAEPCKKFHLVINEEEMNNGMPEWIEYTDIDETHGKFTFHGVSADYTIRLIAE